MFASDSPTYLLSTSAEQINIFVMEDKKSILGSYTPVFTAYKWCMQAMKIEMW